MNEESSPGLLAPSSRNRTMNGTGQESKSMVSVSEAGNDWQVRT